MGFGHFEGAVTKYFPDAEAVLAVLAKANCDSGKGKVSRGVHGGRDGRTKIRKHIMEVQREKMDEEREAQKSV